MPKAETSAPNVGRNVGRIFDAGVAVPVRVIEDHGLYWIIEEVRDGGA